MLVNINIYFDTDDDVNFNICKDVDDNVNIMSCFLFLVSGSDVIRTFC